MWKRAIACIHPLSNPPDPILTTNSVMTVVTRWDVKKGEELTTSYIQPTQSTMTRRQLLNNTWGFWCACIRCRWSSNSTACRNLLELFNPQGPDRVRFVPWRPRMRRWRCPQLWRQTPPFKPPSDWGPLEVPELWKGDVMGMWREYYCVMTKRWWQSSDKRRLRSWSWWWQCWW